MGWFDSDKGDKPDSSAVSSPQPQPARTSAPAPTGREPEGSTLGRKVHVNGTIVCEEPLRVQGRVEGTIRAREDLSIAQGAEVRAVIYGRRIHVEGAVKGDVHASERLVLGSTAVLEGNIGAPSLQIQEGAFFKGSVEMRTAESTPASGKDSTKTPARAAKPDSPSSADTPSKAGEATHGGKATSAPAAAGRRPEKAAAGGSGRSGN